jgi:hypothetical protein
MLEANYQLVFRKNRGTKNENERKRTENILHLEVKYTAFRGKIYCI